MGASTWTAERIETMSRLWIEGQSAAYIAEVLGLTRNAIIGKTNRMGLHRIAPKVRRRFSEEGRNVWTAEKTEELRTLWLTPMTREQIAEQLGDGFTAGSVGAKGKRLKLANRRFKANAPARKAANRTRRAAADDAQQRAQIKSTFRAEHLFAPLEGVTPKPFHERRLDECRWPITDRADDDGVSRLSCCAPRVANSSYCRTHRALGVTSTASPTRVGWDQASHRRRV
jgi:hypothetical protein